MRLKPDNCDLLGAGLDHPESVCLGPDGSVYAGGEAGQVYRISPTGEQHQVGSTGGFLLGIALDADGNIHACDIGSNALVKMDATGQIEVRATAAGDRPFDNPNHGVFDPAGNLFLSSSGDYWNPSGTGFIALVDPNNNATLFHHGPFKFPNGVALHPSGEWLYIAQSTAGNIVRIPTGRPAGDVQVTHQLPPGTIPDGIAMARDGRLVIGCYKPDAVLIGNLDGSVEVLCEDPTGELLSRPTNVAIGDGYLYISNLGGWHITKVRCDLEPLKLYGP